MLKREKDLHRQKAFLMAKIEELDPLQQEHKEIQTRIGNFNEIKNELSWFIFINSLYSVFIVGWLQFELPRRYRVFKTKFFWMS